MDELVIELGYCFIVNGSWDRLRLGLDTRSEHSSRELRAHEAHEAHGYYGWGVLFFFLLA